MSAPGKSREGGFTLVEVLVAILILAIASMTTFSLLSAAARNGQRAKASQIALEFAEQELEFLRSMEDGELALEVPPPNSTNPLNPNYRVSGKGTFALTRDPLGNYRKLVVKGEEVYGGGTIQGGAVSPGPTKFTSGDVSGKVYRYIVWHNDEKCPEASCPGKQDYKQIVVAVRLDTPPSQAAERGYVEVQSNFVNPTDNAESDPLPGSNEQVVTAQQFFLSDTPCASGGSTARQEISGDHLLHNTLGTCASGVQSGTTKGSPDALLLGSPPDPEPEDPTNPAAYDYSSDIAASGTETGLQIRKDDTSGCGHYVPTGTTIPESQVHRWVTDPMPASFVMTEKVTLEFYTRALINNFSAGKLCVYIYKRHETGTPPVATDTLLTNTVGATPYWTYTRPQSEPWPQEWTKIRLTMNFNGAPYTIPAGDRLGLALSVERSETPADGLSFMYDHPLYPSRIEVDTSTPIDGG